MLVAALTVSKGYREYVARRLSEQESFIFLLRHMEEKISRYLTPVADALRDFSNDVLSRIGFFDGINEGETLGEAFLRITPRLSVGEETRSHLSSTFKSLSFGYREEVVANLHDAAARLEKILSEEKELLSKNERVVSAVLVASALGIFILLV